MPAIHLCVIKLEFSCAFSNKVDTEEEEEEEDKEDSPAPKDSVSVEFIDNIKYRVLDAKKVMSVSPVLFDFVAELVNSTVK